jgi:hypothetical protein
MRGGLAVLAGWTIGILTTVGDREFKRGFWQVR